MTDYLVGNTTKEHFLAQNFCVADANDTDLILVKADADGWIEWHGGECPLPDDQLCEVKLRHDDRSISRHKPACQWNWDRWGFNDDIIAYRPILGDVSDPMGREAFDNAVTNDELMHGKSQLPEWDGEGLPHEGTVCEMITQDGWLECEIVFNNNDYAIGHILPAQASLLKCDWSRGGFRPIRTDREKWIEAAGDIAKPEHETARDFLEAIYDALASGDLPQP